jgi:hypothetical protein
VQQEVDVVEDVVLEDVTAEPRAVVGEVLVGDVVDARPAVAFVECVS